MKIVHLAGAVITDGDGRVLLIRRRVPRRQWEIPGGKLERGETPPAAAVRELWEELGVRIRVVAPLGGCAFPEGGDELRYTWLRAVVTDGTPQVRETDTHDRVGWFTRDRLADPRTVFSAAVRKLVEVIDGGGIPVR